MAEHTIKSAGEIEIHRQWLKKASPIPQQEETFFTCIMPVLFIINRADAHTIEDVLLFPKRAYSLYERIALEARNSLV
jgi:hypothetical protein